MNKSLNAIYTHIYDTSFTTNKIGLNDCEYSLYLKTIIMDIIYEKKNHYITKYQFTIDVHTKNTK